MIEKEKSLVPMSFILKEYELFTHREKLVYENSKSCVKYYYFDGVWVRGSNRLEQRINSRFVRYAKLLTLKKCLEEGLSFFECAKITGFCSNQVNEYIQKYTKVHFFKEIKSPLFDIELVKECILDNYYCNASLSEFPNTRYYLYKDLSKNIFSRLSRGTIVKEDFIINVEKEFPFIEFDFSNVPDVLDSLDQFVTLLCNSRNPTNLKEIVGSYKTNYHRIIKLKSLPKSLGTYFIRHTVTEYKNMVEKYKEDEKIFGKYLPSPYFYKVFVKKYRRHSNSNFKIIEVLWIDPFTGTFKEIRSLKEQIPKIYGNISFLEFENLWYLELTPDKLFTEEWAIKKANFYYEDKPEMTRKYISKQLLENHDYKFNGFIVKEDFINKFNETKSERELDIEYYFDNLPDIIMTKKQKVSVAYIYNGELRSSNTCYMDFIERLRDVSDFKMIKIADRLSMTKEEFMDKAIKFHGDHFDFSKSVFIDQHTDILVKCKICGKEQYIRPKSVLVKNYLGCCQNGVISFGELYIKDWINNNKDIIDYYDQHYYIPNNIIEGRSKDGRGVIIDFRLIFESKEYYIEYNGEQHYEYIEHFHRHSKDNFKNQIKRDQNIRDYCSSNNIIFLEIPYIYDSAEKVNNLLNRVFKNKELIEDVIILPEIQNI